MLLNIHVKTATFCPRCQFQHVCWLWLSWKRLRNVCLRRICLWPETEMSVGFSFYVARSGVRWVRPPWNCWNRSSLEPPSLDVTSNLTHAVDRTECESQHVAGNKMCVRVCVIVCVRWGSWLNCWQGRRGSWMEGSTTVQRLVAARWRMFVKISFVMVTTTKAKTMSHRESQGNYQHFRHEVDTLLNTQNFKNILFMVPNVVSFFSFLKLPATE